MSPGQLKTARDREGYPVCAEFTAIRYWRPIESQSTKMVGDARSSAIHVSGFCCTLQETAELDILECSANADAVTPLTRSRVVPLTIAIDAPNR
jgi:hypothetical protein